ncbi:unnamed protein product [Mucor circinelloides]
MTLTMTASSTTDAIVDGMKTMTLDYNHADYHYYPDDTTSDSTVTATTKDLSRHVPRTSTEKRNDWMDEIEHSFESSCNDNNYTLDDFSAHETTIMQSYLEPNCPDLVDPSPLPRRRKSKFSVIKSKVKRVFCIASPPTSHHQQQKQQVLMQSSLPVFPTTATSTCNSSVDTRWNPSIDSSICSSSTLRPPDQTSTHSNNSNASSFKSYPYQNSCGFHRSNSSSPFTAAQKQQRHSTVSRIKNRFSRTPSLGTLPMSVPAPPIKGILKKQTNATTTTTKPAKTMRPSLTRPVSALLPTDPRQQRKKRWSTTRFSVYSSNQNTKKRYSVFSVMNHDKRRSQPLQRTSLPAEQGRVHFNTYLDVQETYAKGDYDRSSDPDAVCNRLTAVTATQIKRELNYFKLHEMEVHDFSREYTHFFT